MISVDIQTVTVRYASVVVILDISLMSDSHVTREYNLHGLSELIIVDKSYN